MSIRLPDYIDGKYNQLKTKIRKRLKEFSQVPESEYFYELCFCICTPQSKAKNAMQVVEKLKKSDFFHNPFNPINILSDKNHYIRFHNQKSKRLKKLIEDYPKVQKLLNSNTSAFEKRNEIKRIINGFGYKEASHFLRNIGYKFLNFAEKVQIPLDEIDLLFWSYETGEILK